MGAFQLLFLIAWGRLPRRPGAPMIDPNASAIENWFMAFALGMVLLMPVAALIFTAAALIRRLGRRLPRPAASFLDVIERR